MLLSGHWSVIVINSHFYVKCIITSENSNILEDAKEVLVNWLEKIEYCWFRWKIITLHFYITLQNINISRSFDLSLSVLCSILLQKMILWTTEHCPELQNTLLLSIIFQVLSSFLWYLFFYFCVLQNRSGRLPWIVVVVFHIY